MSTLEAFRNRIEKFLVDTGMAERSFGLGACSDPSFVADLRAGREPRESTRSKVETFMDGYKMPGAGNAKPAVDPSRNQAA